MASAHPPKPPSYTLKYDATDFSTDLDVPTALFRITQIPYIKSIRSGKYVIASVESEEDYETHLSAATTQKLSEAGLKLVESPEMLASRTLLARKVDDYVLSRQPEEIRKEIASQNSVTVEDVKVLQRPHMLKVKLSSLQECNHLLERGLKLFSRVVPKYNLAQETYTETIQCYKCLQFSHRTARCTADKDTCSKCGQEGHNYKNCTSDITKCFNCGGDHPAVAFKCPKKREAVAAQSRTPQAPTTVTYASAAASHTAYHPSTATPTPAMLQADSKELKEQNSKSYQCLIFAAEAAQGNLSDLAKYYTRLASHNGLPTIEIPSDFIEEVQETYQQAYTTTQTKASHKHKHCRSRSRSHHKKSKKETPAAETPASSTVPHEPPHHPSQDGGPPAASAPASKNTQQRVTRNTNRDPRSQRPQHD